MISKKNGLTSKKIFKAGIANVKREKICRILRTLSKDIEATKLAPFKVTWQKEGG